MYLTLTKRLGICSAILVIANCQTETRLQEALPPIASTKPIRFSESPIPPSPKTELEQLKFILDTIPPELDFFKKNTLQVLRNYKGNVEGINLDFPLSLDVRFSKKATTVFSVNGYGFKSFNPRASKDDLAFLEELNQSLKGKNLLSLYTGGFFNKEGWTDPTDGESEFGDNLLPIRRKNGTAYEPAYREAYWLRLATYETSNSTPEERNFLIDIAKKV
jgi:hypothetical protein